MTHEEIIKLARKAGIAKHGLGWTCWEGQLERFAALVAAAEREKVARWHIGSGYTTGHGDTVEDLLKELEWQIREREREACAKVCEDIDTEYEGQDVLATWCAAAIRARGQA